MTVTLHVEVTQVDTSHTRDSYVTLTLVSSACSSRTNLKVEDRVVRGVAAQ